MGLLDMFDKLDDIVYKPIETICDWVKEPLKSLELKRQMKETQQRANIEAERARLEQELRAKERHDQISANREQAELEIDIRRWNEEINNLIADREVSRRDSLVKSLKQYQFELAQATNDMVKSLSEMAIDMRAKAGALIDTRTQAYKKMQDDIKESSLKELAQAKELFFESDPDTYHMLVGTIMEERKTMIENAGKFISELAVDLSRINIEIGKHTDDGSNNINKILMAMVKNAGEDIEQLYSKNTDSLYNNKQL